METIRITKLVVLELIKNNEIIYYDHNEYKEWKIKIETGYTQIMDDHYTVNISMEDLATLLFDRCFSNDSILITVF